MLNFYRKKKKFDIRNILFYANLLVFVGCIIYLGNYYLVGAKSEAQIDKLTEKIKDSGIDATIVDKKEEVDEDGNLVIMDKYKVLLEDYPDIVGWIKVESVEGVKESPIDYPVMQTVNDPQYYIDKDVNGDYSREGTPFLDYRSDITKPTDNYIIYAHNMANKHQFGSLKLFRNEEYYKEHPTIKFETLYSAGTYEIVAAFYAKIYNKDDDVFKYYNFIDTDSEEEFDEFIKTIKKRSLYDTGVDAKYGDQLLTLSTCNYDISTVEKSRGRFVVVARLKKNDETTESILGDENDIEDDKYITDGTTPTPIPEETLEPEETPDPEDDEPEDTKKPEKTKKPKKTKKPEKTKEPEDTKKPEKTKKPKKTKEPDKSKEPEVTKEPESSKEPQVTDNPDSTPTDIPTQEPDEGESEDPTTPGEGEEDPTTPEEGGEEDPTTPGEGGEEDPTTPEEGGEDNPTNPEEGEGDEPTTPEEGQEGGTENADDGE